MSTGPRDGPATSFEADPLVASLFTKEDDYFCLVMVAGWPPNPQVMDPPYQEFLQTVRSCFGDSDLSGERPNVYLYPSQSLHVTIATLYPLKKREPGIDYGQLIADYSDLVRAASQQPDWPSAPLQLQVESAQLGAKAGILLWKELTGGIHQMRLCLEQESQARQLSIHAIPGIIHSSFCRFLKVPDTKGDEIQEQFQSSAVPRVAKIFERTIPAHSVKLVSETTPYMHIPNDDEHVLVCLELST
jgi:hypothetical protein